MRVTALRHVDKWGKSSAFCGILILFAAGNSWAAGEKQGDPAMNFELASTAFRAGDYIPRKHTGEGADLSPELHWVNPPAGTLSFALICDDPDAPVGTWVHWVIFNIPATASGLPEGVPNDKELKDKSLQGINDFRKIGYGGPMPPRGSDHRYFFKLYALDIPLSLKAGATKADLLKAMDKHIVGQVELMGRYRR